MSECVHHWHCDPNSAAHDCTMIDRSLPCPDCREEVAVNVEVVTYCDEARIYLNDNTSGRQVGVVVFVFSSGTTVFRVKGDTYSPQQARMLARCIQVAAAKAEEILAAEARS